MYVTHVDCSVNDIEPIGMCMYTPDGNPYTYDSYAGFNSTCDETADMCTVGTIELTHTCDALQCGAQCDATTSCADTACDGFDGCYEGTYRDYSDVSNSCQGDCSCTANACMSYVEVVTDADGDGYDTQCDYDCDDANASVNPGATEICDDLVDNDCDGYVDSADSDCGAVVDADGDGVHDDVDKCLGSAMPENVPTQSLRPNHYADLDGDAVLETNTGSTDSPVIEDGYSLVDTFGCTCEQVLFCKPGGNGGEYKFGCTSGTMDIWMSQSAWSTDCQVDGKVVLEGESKDILEDTDNAGLVDLIDADNDNDGIPDSEDSEPDSAPDSSGNPKGKPDWWCQKNPSKC